MKTSDMPHKQEFTNSFRRAQMNFAQLYGRLLAEENHGIQQFALLNLLSEMGSISMTEASQRLGVSKPAVTHIVDQLDKRKMVKRVIHPEDRRSFLLVMRPAGEETVARIQKEVFLHLFEALEGLPRKNQDSVNLFYQNLCASMEQRKELTSR